MNTPDMSHVILATAAAQAVVSHFIDGSEQGDCQMHNLNLVMLYDDGIRLQDKMKSQKLMGEDGVERKVQDVVTGEVPSLFCVVYKSSNPYKKYASVLGHTAIKPLEQYSGHQSWSYGSTNSGC